MGRANGGPNGTERTGGAAGQTLLGAFRSRGSGILTVPLCRVQPPNTFLKGLRSIVPLCGIQGPRHVFLWMCPSWIRCTWGAAVGPRTAAVTAPDMG